MGRLIIPSLFFLLEVALDILVSFLFHVNFRIILFISTCRDIVVNQVNFETIEVFTRLNLPIREYGLSYHIFSSVLFLAMPHDL